MRRLAVAPPARSLGLLARPRALRRVAGWQRLGGHPDSSRRGLVVSRRSKNAQNGVEWKISRRKMGRGTCKKRRILHPESQYLLCDGSLTSLAHRQPSGPIAVHECWIVSCRTLTTEARGGAYNITVHSRIDRRSLTEGDAVLLT